MNTQLGESGNQHRPTLRQRFLAAIGADEDYFRRAPRERESGSWMDAADDDQANDVLPFIYDVIRTSIAANLIAHYQFEMAREGEPGRPERLQFYDLYVSNCRALGWLLKDDRESAAYSVAVALTEASITNEFPPEARPPIWAAAACVRHSLSAPGAGLSPNEAGEFMATVFDALADHAGPDVISARKRREVLDGVNWSNPEWRAANPESVAELSQG